MSRENLFFDSQIWQELSDRPATARFLERIANTLTDGNSTEDRLADLLSGELSFEALAAGTVTASTTMTAQTVTADALSVNGQALTNFAANVNTDGTIDGAALPDDVALTSASINLDAGSHYQINDVSLLMGRSTGWAGSTGARLKGGMDTDATVTISNPPTTAEVEAVRDLVLEARRVVAALEDALSVTNGIIGS